MIYTLNHFNVIEDAYHYFFSCERLLEINVLGLCTPVQHTLYKNVWYLSDWDSSQIQTFIYKKKNVVHDYIKTL